MLRKKCQEIADKAFYNEFLVPNKMIYIKKIMESCKTESQLDDVLKWGKECIFNIWRLHDRNIREKYSTCDAIYITGKFGSNMKLIIKDITRYYGELLRKM